MKNGEYMMIHCDLHGDRHRPRRSTHPATVETFYEHNRPVFFFGKSLDRLIEPINQPYQSRTTPCLSFPI